MWAARRARGSSPPALPGSLGGEALAALAAVGAWPLRSWMELCCWTRSSPPTEILPRIWDGSVAVAFLVHVACLNSAASSQ